MPRQSRLAIGGYVYHVLNRANGKTTMFNKEVEYKEFECLLLEARERFNMRILAYTIMPNHWHLLLHPREDQDMPNFMRWLSTTHATKMRHKTKTVGGGHVYQGRYKSFVVDTDAYLLTVLKYIERNPARAKLVKLPEEWKWGSAHRRIHGASKDQAVLAPSPTPLPHQYRRWIHDEEKQEDIFDIRGSVNRGAPFGGEKFIKDFSSQRKIKKDKDQK